MYYVEIKIYCTEREEYLYFHKQIIEYLHKKFVNEINNISGKNKFAIEYPRHTSNEKEKMFGNIIRIVSNNEIGFERLDLKNLKELISLDDSSYITVIDKPRKIPVQNISWFSYKKEHGIIMENFIKRFCYANGWTTQEDKKKHKKELDEYREKVSKYKERNPYVTLYSDSQETEYKFIVKKERVENYDGKISDSFSTYGMSIFTDSTNSKIFSAVPEW